MESAPKKEDINNEPDLAAEEEFGRTQVDGENTSTQESIEKQPQNKKGDSGFSKLRNIHKEAREKIKNGVIEEMKAHGIDDASDERIDSLVDDITGSVQRREFRNSFVSRLRTAIVIMMVTLLSLSMVIMFKLDGNHIEKDVVKQSISQAISNEADLVELKSIFSFKARPTQDIFGPLLQPDTYYKVESLTLQHVLEELKVDILTSSEFDDQSKEFRGSLNEVLEKYLKVNPFEGLDDNNKKDLSNITIKLGIDNYKIIQSEIEGLTESLKVKNSLIREYLNSSNMSLYISISAFIFSILVVLWQFFPNSRTSQRQLITEAIKEHSKDLEINSKN